jgi:hypothetical protein
MKNLVKLTSQEIGSGVRIGGLRHYFAIAQDKKDAYGYDGEHGWQLNIEGALGELAVAKFLNIYWDGSVNTWKANDLQGIQVRTRSKNYYDLIVRDNDNDDAIYILAIGKNGVYNVMGWINGIDAKKEEWKQTYGDRPSAYFVPQSKLNDINTLKIR